MSRHSLKSKIGCKEIIVKCNGMYRRMRHRIQLSVTSEEANGLR